MIFDLRVIGNKLFAVRKKLGLTQLEVAEASGLSDRTYADIERGTVNMRIETILKICQALRISPDDILTESNPDLDRRQHDILDRLSQCSPREKETALALLDVYLRSLA